jgi:phosphocarrier protein HPr
MRTCEITIKHPVGLHARPAALFVTTAKKYVSKVGIKYQNQTADAKSLLELLSLGITKDSTIEIFADGDDEETTISDLINLVKSNFNE